MTEQLVFLVPGFFGFEDLEGLHYFRGAGEVLTRALGARGVEARVVECSTGPTSSIRRRAARLVAEVVDAGGLEASAIHFVGHSAGGLDVRMLLTPGVSLPSATHSEAVAARTKTAISLASPHWGTPVANFFATAYGRYVLDLLTTVVHQPHGRAALYLAAKATSLRGRPDDPTTTTTTGELFGVISGRVLQWIRGASSDPIWTFIQDVSTDLGLIIQLTPEAMDLFNAAVIDRPGVSYASVITGVRVPVGAFSRRLLWAPERLASAALFALTYGIATMEHANYPYPRPDQAVLAPFIPRTPFALSSTANDGMIPTLSQIHGRVLDVLEADHLDVVGHYDRPNDDSFNDWMGSGSGFDDERFEQLYSTIAEAISG